jgi:hypothetical protein
MPSETKDVVPAFSSAGAITLPAARLKVDATYPHGRKERCELTVVYDPQFGHYLWHISRSNPNDPDNTGVYLKVLQAQRAVPFSDAAGLIDFGFAGTVFAKAWTGQASSLDAAVAASINEMQQQLPAKEHGTYHLDYKFVPVFGLVPGFNAQLPPGFKPMPDGFACLPNTVSFCPGDKNTIASITKQGSNWRLVLRNRYDEEVIVDQNFNLLSMQQLTQPKQ